MMNFNHQHTVLVLDDEVGPRQAIRVILEGKYNVLTCSDPQEAIDAVASGQVDVVLLDIKMPGIDGLSLLKALKELGPDVEIALITGYPSTESAIEAMQHGAYDYIIKPFDKDRIVQVVQTGIILRTKKKLHNNLTSNLISTLFEKFPHKK